MRGTKVRQQPIGTIIPVPGLTKKSETWEKDGERQKGDAHEDGRGSICPTDFYKIRLGTY